VTGIASPEESKERAMKINRRIAIRATLLVALTVALSVASIRLRAATGTCGGTSITLPFTDVPSGNIFFCSIAEAFICGLTNGTDATHYSPSGNVPREQMAAFITRTQDSALKRGSHRAALNQWAIPTSVPSTGKTAVGNSPEFVASDGEDLWVASGGSGTVSRVHASDGKLLGTWTGAVAAFGVVIARGRVFVTGDNSPGAIYVIDPSQAPGAVTTLTSSLPDDPLGIAFDGSNLWTANTDSGSISKVNPNGGAVTNFGGFNSPFGIIYDGTNIWFTDSQDQSLKKVDKSTGAVLLTVTVQIVPEGPIFDGANIWVPNFGSNSVTVVKASTGVVLATLTGNGLSGPVQAAFDGERILVTNESGASVSLWNASDLTALGFATGATNVFGACSDGLNFWLTVQDGPPGHLVRF